MQITSGSAKLTDPELNEIRFKLQTDTCSDDERRRIVQDMAYHQCSWPEIGSMLGVTRQMIEEKYRDVLNIAQTQLKHDLRRLQLSCGGNNKGSTSMLIWLGKQYLEQSDTPQMEIKKDQFDEFIEWISTQKASSSRQAKSKSTASSTATPE